MPITSDKYQQRQSAKDLLKHRFIKTAKKNSFLIELIEKYRKWQVENDNSSESDSDNGKPSADKESSKQDEDWDFGGTVKMKPSAQEKVARKPVQQGSSATTIPPGTYILYQIILHLN